MRLGVVSVESAAGVRLVEAEPFFFLPFSRASHQGVDRRKFKPFANPDTNQTVAAVCVDRLTIPLSLSLSLSLALSPYSAEEQVLTLAFPSGHHEYQRMGSFQGQ